MGTSCCMNCDKRELGCHDTCKEYKAWKRDMRRKKVWLNVKNAAYGKSIHRINRIYGDRETKVRYGVYRR